MRSGYGSDKNNSIHNIPILLHTQTKLVVLLVTPIIDLLFNSITSLLTKSFFICLRIAIEFHRFKIIFAADQILFTWKFVFLFFVQIKIKKSFHKYWNIKTSFPWTWTCLHKLSTDTQSCLFAKLNNRLLHGELIQKAVIVSNNLIHVHQSG